MRIVAKILTVLAVAAVLLFGYVKWASEIGASYDSITVASCADYPENFAAYREVAATQGSEVTLFGELPGYDPSQYQFVSYTVELRNINLLPAEWIDLVIVPIDGDVMQINAAAQDLAPFNSSKMSILLITSRNTPTLARQAKLTYYVYGRLYELYVTLNG